MYRGLRQIIRSFGIDVVRYLPTSTQRARAISSQRKESNFLKLLTLYEIDLVLDVGANVGQYAKNLFEIGYEGKVLSFEPLSSAYEQLLEASKSNYNWEIAERCAISDENGEIEINISKNSQSSSALPMLQSHIDAAPNSIYIGSEIVKKYKLSQVAFNHIKRSQSPFLKIDVQGFEDKVLNGASEILPKIRGVQLELSVVPLYEGQLLFEDMLANLKAMGFSLYGLTPGFADYRTGRLLQFIGTFFRDLTDN